MLDPRIYRMALILPALALVVLAFSLRSQPAALHSSLSPAAYNGGAVTRQMTAIAANPQISTLTAGSAGDRRLAGEVASSLRAGSNFSVTTDRATATTPQGPRTLESVVATRAGSLPGAGSVVVVATRDGRGGPTAAVTSPTATLVELSRVLGGETLRRTVVLASISGSQGAAGAIRLARTLPRPIDAVVVLGDLASSSRRQPVVIPWTSDATIAPPRLRNTLTAALRSQSSIRTSMPGVVAQLAHLAFPLTISPQGPLGADAIPAVELSLSGESGAAGVGSPGRPLSGARLTGQLNAVGRSILTTVSALDGGATVPAPSTYVLFAGKVVPRWAMSLFVLALIVPVLLTMIDGIARARRRSYLVGRAVVTVLAAAVPFAVAGVVLVIGGAAGALPSLPSAIGPGVVPVGGGAIAMLAVTVVTGLAGAVGVRFAFAALRTRQGTRASHDTRGARDTRTTRDPRARVVDRSDDGTAAALLLVMSVAVVLLWIANPFAAALTVPALHLWLWAVDSDLRLVLPVRIVMLLVGVLPVVGLVVFYSRSLGYGPGGVAWEAVLLVAGQAVSLWAGLLWSVMLGCLTTAVVLAVAASRRPETAAGVGGTVSSIRGPLGYAGPGSLGGTKSAIRR